MKCLMSLFYSLNVPGELLKTVYAAASALRLDRAANECARFMARYFMPLIDQMMCKFEISLNSVTWISHLAWKFDLPLT